MFCYGRLGLLVRDSARLVPLSSSFQTYLVAELLAILEAVHLARSLNYSHPQIESDAHTAIKVKLISDESNWIVDIRNLVLTFDLISFLHVPREGNKRSKFFSKIWSSFHCLISWSLNFSSWLLPTVEDNIFSNIACVASII